MEGQDDRRTAGSNAASFSIGLVAGLLLGVGAALLLAPKKGDALRADVADGAKKMKDTVTAGYRRASESVGDLAGRAGEVAGRARTAATEGLREARRHMDAPQDPRRSDVAGVDGMIDGVGDS